VRINILLKDITPPPSPRIILINRTQVVLETGLRAYCDCTLIIERKTKIIFSGAQSWLVVDVAVTPCRRNVGNEKTEYVSKHRFCTVSWNMWQSGITVSNDCVIYLTRPTRFFHLSSPAHFAKDSLTVFDDLQVNQLQTSEFWSYNRKDY
jgi:hypothetical protein